MNPDATTHVTISSDPSALGVLRAVAAGLAAAADLDFVAIEDMGIATDEAALQLIGSGADRLRASFEITDEGLVVEMVALGEMADVEPSADAAIGRDILSALVDDLEVGAGVVRFTRRSTSG